MEHQWNYQNEHHLKKRSTSNLILIKTLLHFQTIRAYINPTQKMSLDSNSRSRIKSYRPIKIQKTFLESRVDKATLEWKPKQIRLSLQPRTNPNNPNALWVNQIRNENYIFAWCWNEIFWQNLYYINKNSYTINYTLASNFSEC
jgi:hypothetical protein